MLIESGPASTPTHIIGCLQQRTESLIIESMDVGGLHIRAVIDTGATASFMPLHGRIAKHIRPTMKPADIKVETVNDQVNTDIFSTKLMLKPWISENPSNAIL